MVPHSSRSIEVSETTGDARVVARLLPYLWPKDEPALRRMVVLAVGFVICAKIATVSVPYFFRGAINQLTDPIGPEILVPIALIVGFGLVTILQVAFTQFQDAAIARPVERAVRKLQLKIVDHLQAQSLRFHLDRQTGALSRTIERGARAIDMLLTMVALRTIPAMLQFVFVCGILWYLYGWTYAFVTFLSTFSYIYYTFTVTDWRVKFRREMNASDGAAHTKLVDALINYETVKYFGNEANEYKRLDQSWGEYENAAVRSKSSLALLNTGQGAIIAVGASVVLLMAAYDVRSGAMTIGDLVAVNMWLTQLFIPLNFLGMLYREVKQAIVDLELVFALIDQEPEIVDNAGAKNLEKVNGRITFDNVKFAYKSDRPILNGLTFTAEPGERVAIVGPTGAGKSTIVRLLFRFFDVTGGAVKIDGQDIRDLRQSSLRHSVGIVPQDTVLFNDDIRYNIAYGRLDASDADLQQSIEKAQLSSFIKKLPNGLKTSVGERGLKLSGGEKQRVSIARAILKQPKILVFDEATSSLDMVTEKEILSAMREASQGRTTIIIAHRLSTITDSDNILVLDEGRVVESGTHHELLSRNGLYAELWEAQKRELDEQSTRRAQMPEAVPAE